MVKIYDEKSAIVYCDEINCNWLTNHGKIKPYHKGVDSFSEAHYRFLINDGRVEYKHFQGSASGHDYYLFIQATKTAYAEGVEEGKRQALAAITEMLQKAIK